MKDNEQWSVEVDKRLATKTREEWAYYAVALEQKLGEITRKYVELETDYDVLAKFCERTAGATLTGLQNLQDKSRRKRHEAAE
jgi:hypothetical protein